MKKAINKTPKRRPKTTISEIIENKEERDKRHTKCIKAMKKILKKDENFILIIRRGEDCRLISAEVSKKMAFDVVWYAKNVLDYEMRKEGGEIKESRLKRKRRNDSQS